MNVFPGKGVPVSLMVQVMSFVVTAAARRRWMSFARSARDDNSWHLNFQGSFFSTGTEDYCLQLRGYERVLHLPNMFDAFISFTSRSWVIINYDDGNYLFIYVNVGELLPLVHQLQVCIQTPKYLTSRHSISLTIAPIKFYKKSSNPQVIALGLFKSVHSYRFCWWGSIIICIKCKLIYMLLYIYHYLILYVVGSCNSRTSRTSLLRPDTWSSYMHDLAVGFYDHNFLLAPAVVQAKIFFCYKMTTPEKILTSNILGGLCKDM